MAKLQPFRNPWHKGLTQRGERQFRSCNSFAALGARRKGLKLQRGVSGRSGGFETCHLGLKLRQFRNPCCKGLKLQRKVSVQGETCLTVSKPYIDRRFRADSATLSQPLAQRAEAAAEGFRTCGWFRGEGAERQFRNPVERKFRSRSCNSFAALGARG